MSRDLTAAREALAAADTAVPPSEWWEIACSDGHELNHCDSEDEASATFNENRGCDNDGCHARVELHHIKRPAQLPRWSFVDAAHLRAALAAVDELTRERDELRAALAEARATKNTR